MSEYGYKLPRSAFYRACAELENDWHGNVFVGLPNDFLGEQSTTGDRDNALMVCPYEWDVVNEVAITKVPRDVRVLMLCLMASISEEIERSEP